MVRASLWTCVFLVALRLAIGWHFFFEGVQKIRSTKIGDKPFSSQAYFNEAEGPLGPKVREQIGDPDLQALAKLKLREGDNEIDRMPEALAKEWDAYFDRFVAFYKLDDNQKKLADARRTQAKQLFVQWRTDSIPKKKADGKEPKKDDEPKKVKKEFPASMGSVSYEVEDKVTQRVLDYEAKLREIRDVYERRLPAMGRDVEKTHIRELKSEAAKMRTDLLKDVEDHTKKYHQSLAKIVSGRLLGYDVGVPPESVEFDAKLYTRMLTLQDGPESGEGLAARMPETLGQQWEECAAYLKEIADPSKRQPERDAEKIKAAKVRYVRFLLGQDEYTGKKLENSDIADRLKAYQTLISKIDLDNGKYDARATSIAMVAGVSAYNTETIRSIRQAQQLRADFLDDIKRHTEILKRDLGGLSVDNGNGLLDPEVPSSSLLGVQLPTSKLDWLDTSTRWMLTVAGACLLLGLFTRLACVTAAGFLLMEYLSNTPLPWLPKSPMTEGNYVFVNKNLIEFIALLLLMTTASGRWLGLDALLCRVWPFRQRSKETESV